jgi:hypothetical protein
MNLGFHPHLETKIRARAEAQGLSIEARLQRLVHADTQSDDELRTLALAGLDPGDPVGAGAVARHALSRTIRLVKHAWPSCCAGKIFSALGAHSSITTLISAGRQHGSGLLQWLRWPGRSLRPDTVRETCPLSRRLPASQTKPSKRLGCCEKRPPRRGFPGFLWSLLPSQASRQTGVWESKAKSRHLCNRPAGRENQERPAAAATSLFRDSCHSAM